MCHFLGHPVRSNHARVEVNLSKEMHNRNFSSMANSLAERKACVEKRTRR